MKITSIEISNLRGFSKVDKTNLSESINLFIGPNNAGKSTILSSVFLIQRPSVLNNNDVKIGQTNSEIVLGITKPPQIFNPNYNRIVFRFGPGGPQRYVIDNNSNQQELAMVPEIEPHNLIYPYLSKRKVVNYNDTINEENANSVFGNFTNLFSKIDRLITPQFFSGNIQYISACNNILGFEISTKALGRGKQAVYYVHNFEHIPLTAMGEGVSSVLGLITDLCIAEDKIFLIEEPENDIHPKALKALLKLIIEKSSSNQFFISTHSNIVMKYLGGVSTAKIFNVTNDLRDSKKQNLFISKITEVSDKPEERRQILEELGYDFFDFDLWKGWLFLEESSAEVIIRDYLIDWFVKPLKSKIKTFSAGGTTNIIPKFEDFNKLFVFLHLEPTYKNRVWVQIDAGEKEEKIINEMKEKYCKSGWEETNFSQFNEHDFEKYFPAEFQKKVSEIIGIKDKTEKRKAKKNLLEEVKTWIGQDEKRAKEEFKISAKEVIERLEEINKELNK